MRKKILVVVLLTFLMISFKINNVLADYSCSPPCEYGCKDGECLSESETYSWTECVSLKGKDCNVLCKERNLVASNSCIDSRGTGLFCMELWGNGGCDYEDSSSMHPCLDMKVAHDDVVWKCCCGQAGLKYIEEQLNLIKEKINEIREGIIELITKNWKSCKNEKYDYELKHPLDWEFIKKSEEKIVIIKEKGCFFTLSLSYSIDEDIRNCELAHGSYNCGKKEKTINDFSFIGFTWADESDEYFFKRSNQQFSIRLFYPETESFTSEKYLDCKDELNRVTDTFEFLD